VEIPKDGKVQGEVETRITTVAPSKYPTHTVKSELILGASPIESIQPLPDSPLNAPDLDGNDNSLRTAQVSNSVTFQVQNEEIRNSPAFDDIKAVSVEGTSKDEKDFISSTLINAAHFRSSNENSAESDWNL
jgi:hypothetical protein